MAAETEGDRGKLGLGELFFIFLKAGCAFGGGIAVLGILDRELVVKRKLLSSTDLLTLWGIGRIVPCGTMTAVTVALGHRFCGQLGIILGLVAVILPGFVSTVILAAAYGPIAHGPALAYIGVTLMPAALAFIIVSAVRIGRDIFRPSIELLLAVGGFAAAVGLGVNPAIILVAGGILGALFLRVPDGTAP